MKYFFLFTALVATTALWAADFEVDGIAYNKLGGDSVAVTYKSPKYSDSVTIPATVTYGSTTYRVTSIGNYAFYECSSLTSIHIPNSVTSLGEKVFQNCASLLSITIPNSVVSIGTSCLSDCSALEEVYIGDGLTTIAGYDFCNCPSVKVLKLGKNIQTIAEFAFFRNTSLMDIYCDAVTPPTINVETAIRDINKHCTIHVPVGSVRAYQSAEHWKTFYNIVESFANTALITSANSAQGLAFGSGGYGNDTTICIGASPFDGYKFSHWSDGDTIAARMLYITSDTNLTAYFEPIVAPMPIHDTIVVGIHDTVYTSMLEVNSMNPTMGSAVVQVCAIPEEGYQFLCWSDYNITNPRLVDISSGVPQTYTAIFTSTTPTALRKTSTESTPASQKINYKGVVYIVTPNHTFNVQGAEL